MSLSYNTLRSTSEKAKLLCRELGTSFFTFEESCAFAVYYDIFQGWSFPCGGPLCKIKPYKEWGGISNKYCSVFPLSVLFVVGLLFFFPLNSSFEVGLKLILWVLIRHMCFPFLVSDSTDCVGGGGGFWHLLAASSCDPSLGWIWSFPTDSSLLSLQGNCTLPGLQQFFCEPNHICISIWKF